MDVEFYNTRGNKFRGGRHVVSADYADDLEDW